MKANVGEQPALPGLALLCGTEGCGKDAVCGLRNKTYPDLRINACAQCFEEITGRVFSEEMVPVP